MHSLYPQLAPGPPTLRQRMFDRMTQVGTAVQSLGGYLRLAQAMSGEGGFGMLTPQGAPGRGGAFRSIVVNFQGTSINIDSPISGSEAENQIRAATVRIMTEEWDRIVDAIPPVTGAAQ